ncbi:hypothetical protein Tco_1525876 [Tanacetum coccineum]
MIGALMYLTSSRPDIVHATCLCARYQAKPTEKHLKEVKRIFRYLRGTVNTGLWYTKDSGIERLLFSNLQSWKVYSVICSTNYSNGENQVVSKSSAVTTADASDKRQQQQDSTSSTSTLATTITADGNFDL